MQNWVTIFTALKLLGMLDVGWSFVIMPYVIYMVIGLIATLVKEMA